MPKKEKSKAAQKFQNPLNAEDAGSGEEAGDVETGSAHSPTLKDGLHAVELGLGRGLADGLSMGRKGLSLVDGAQDRLGKGLTDGFSAGLGGLSAGLDGLSAGLGDEGGLRVAACSSFPPLASCCCCCCCCLSARVPFSKRSLKKRRRWDAMSRRYDSGTKETSSPALARSSHRLMRLCLLVITSLFGMWFTSCSPALCAAKSI